MKVEIRTKNESSCVPPKPFVYINANDIMYSVAVLEEKIRAMQAARSWLKRELTK